MIGIQKRESRNGAGRRHLSKDAVAELRSALSMAHGFFKSRWSKGPIEVCLKILSRIPTLMEERRVELARILVEELGKRLAEALTKFR